MYIHSQTYSRMPKRPIVASERARVQVERALRGALPGLRNAVAASSALTAARRRTYTRLTRKIARRHMKTQRTTLLALRSIVGIVESKTRAKRIDPYHVRAASKKEHRAHVERLFRARLAEALITRGILPESAREGRAPSLEFLSSVLAKHVMHEALHSGGALDFPLFTGALVSDAVGELRDYVMTDDPDAFPDLLQVVHHAPSSWFGAQQRAFENMKYATTTELQFLHRVVQEGNRG